MAPLHLWRQSVPGAGAFQFSCHLNVCVLWAPLGPGCNTVRLVLLCNREKKGIFIYFFFNFFFNVYLFLGQRETEHERGRGRERGRHRIGNRLQALSRQPRARRGARTHRPRDRDLAEVGRLTDCATQAPRKRGFLTHIPFISMAARGLHLF